MPTTGVSRAGAVLLPVAVVLIASTPAWAAPLADPAIDARRAYEEATAAFGLGHYQAAAEKYEEAFSMRPDPALLYNAAQSYRLAGNKTRAFELYRNYVRLYADRPNAADARNQVAALKKAIDDDRATTGVSRPAVAPPRPSSPPFAAPAAPRAAASAPSVLPPPARSPDVAQPPLLTSDVAVATSPRTDADREPSLTRRPWLWVALGAVVLAGTVAVLLATRGEKFPNPTIGRAEGP